MPERTVPAASRGSARRHRIEGGRKHQIKIRFTDAEYEAIAARAAEARVSVQRFLVDSALAQQHRPRRSAPAALIAELAALRRLTSNLANNMNQIARALNSGANPDARIPATVDSVARTMSRLDNALAWFPVPPPRNNVPTDQQPYPDLRKADPDRSGEPAAHRPDQSAEHPNQSAERKAS